MTWNTTSFSPEKTSEDFFSLGVRVNQEDGEVCFDSEQV